MRLILLTTTPETHEIFAWRLRSLPQVTAQLGKFEGLDDFDCIATAGNSFGLMDAGIDRASVPESDSIFLQSQRHLR